MRPLRTFTALTAAAALALTLAACSSSTDATTAPSSAAASAQASAAGSADPETAAAQAACDEIVAGQLSQADAEALVTTAGLESRIGSVDGKPNALTMDYNPQRVTLTLEGGVVTACIVG